MSKWRKQWAIKAEAAPKYEICSGSDNVAVECIRCRAEFLFVCVPGALHVQEDDVYSSQLQGVQKSLNGFKSLCKIVLVIFKGFNMSYDRGSQKALFMCCAAHCVNHLPT